MKKYIATTTLLLTIVTTQADADELHQVSTGWLRPLCASRSTDRRRQQPIGRHSA